MGATSDLEFHADRVAEVTDEEYVAVTQETRRLRHPLDHDQVRIRPAAASDPLITTVKDVTALLIYFGLAAVLLAELL